jgi:hypothetical protein
LNKLVDVIKKAFLNSICNILLNDFDDVRKAKKTWFNLNYLLFSVLNYSRLSKEDLNENQYFTVAIITMQKMNLLSNNSVQFYNQNQEIIMEVFRKIMYICGSELSTIDLSLLHEHLLGIELKIQSGCISTTEGKNNKDITGAYYTPTDLAKEVVQKAFKKYEEDNGKIHKKISIADLSCGGGEFFRAAQAYMEKNYKIQPRDSSKFFWGIDVDPIALQNTICHLLSQSLEKDWEEIISHFFLGNPLIGGEEGSFDEKCDMFAIGRIYSPLMGIDFLEKHSTLKFDIVVGNPPWEKIRFEERRFFANICPDIAAISKKDERRKIIEELNVKWPEVFIYAKDVCNDYAAMSSTKFFHPKLKHTVVGELNTYALFTELAFEITKPSGVCSLIVKSALATSPVNKTFWNMIVSEGYLDSIYLFDNKKKIFSIDSRERFCVITLTHTITSKFTFMAGLQAANEMATESFSLVSSNDMKIINPFTKMLPNVNKTKDMQVLIDAHREFPIFEDVYPNCHFGRLIHLTAHASFIDTIPLDTNIPIYEGKFIEQYDARFSTFDMVEDEKKYAPKASSRKNLDNGNGKPLPVSRYFVQKSLWKKYQLQYPENYSLCWRSLTSNTNARTTLAMILPTCPTCQSIQLLQVESEIDLLMLLGLFNSIPFDYFVRLKMPGIDLTQSVIKQIPVPTKMAYERSIRFLDIEDSLEKHIISHLYCLLRNEPLVSTLLMNIAYPIYEIESNSDSLTIRKNLDYLFAQAYGLCENSLKEIIKTFPKY